MGTLNPNLSPPPSHRHTLTVEDYVEGIRSGDRVRLGQAITLVESSRPPDHERVQAVVTACLPYAGEAIRVGVTGVPGVGKSTFIEALGSRLTGDGHRVAVLAIDPTSERSGGSILGDKTRMPRLAADDRAFVRPSPTAGTLGGVGRRTRETITLCEAAGYDVVLVETVGVGQAETTVHSMVDFFLLLALASGGDELQGIKRGIMEMADALVINKAEGRNAEAAKQAQATYSNAMKLLPKRTPGWTPPVLTCSALEGTGLGPVWSAVERFQTHASARGLLVERRRQQAVHWMRQTVEAQLLHDFYHADGVRERLEDAKTSVLDGSLSSTAAAERLLDAYRRGSAETGLRGADS